MSYDFAPIAQDLARWLGNRPGITDLQPPVLSPKRPAKRPRLPMPLGLPLPKPPFLKGGPTPSFALHFTFKGEHRTFVYFVEALDDLEAVRSTLRVHTNGELMVRVPDEFGHLMPNEIYYANFSAAASGLGRVAPSS